MHEYKDQVKRRNLHDDEDEIEEDISGRDMSSLTFLMLPEPYDSADKGEGPGDSFNPGLNLGG